MNLRGFILGSVAINLALVGALLFQTARQRAVTLPEARLMVITNVVTEAAVAPAKVMPAVAVAGSPPFQWSQLEATNILVVATNLLAIGCPAETALDLLEARLADDLRARLRELMRPFNGRFWELAATRGQLESMIKGTATEATVEQWTREHDQVLKALRQVLPVPAAKSSGKASASHYRHLSAEKETQLAELEARHNQETGKLRSELAQLPGPERATKLKETRDRQQTERAALLSPAEQSEVELRRSLQAAKVRELRGFMATPAELRALALTLKDFDATHPQPPRPDPTRLEDMANYEAKVAALETERKALLLARLGAQRVAEFERGSDPRFHTLLKLARRLEVPSAAAGHWLVLQNTTQNQAADTRQNAQLSPEARTVALAAIRAAAEQELQAAVGARGWGAYQRYAGDWLKQVAR